MSSNLRFTLFLLFAFGAATALLVHARQHRRSNTTPVEEGNLLIGAPLDPTAAHNTARVQFNIEPTEPTQRESTAWLCTYASNDHTARFRIELDTPYSSDQSEVATVFFGKGRIIPVDGSDNRSLLSALAIALEASKTSGPTVRLTELPFTYTGFGDHFTHAPGGGYQTKPSGDWKVTKIFLGESSESDEGQVFLSFNPSERHAEFSIKDSDYGDIVLRHLATVL